jgi:hypothetical protein
MADLVTPFACTNLRWNIGVLPQQTGVYVPRRLGTLTWQVAVSALASPPRPAGSVTSLIGEEPVDSEADARPAEPRYREPRGYTTCRRPDGRSVPRTHLIDGGQAAFPVVAPVMPG